MTSDRSGSPNAIEPERDHDHLVVAVVVRRVPIVRTVRPAAGLQARGPEALERCPPPQADRDADGRTDEERDACRDRADDDLPRAGEERSATRQQAHAGADREQRHRG